MVTLVCFFIPVINPIAPLVGGFVGAYWQKVSVAGGILTGVFMGLLMILPGLLISGILIRAVPKVGIIMGGGLLFVTLVLALFTALLGMVGRGIGDFVSKK